MFVSVACVLLAGHLCLAQQATGPTPYPANDADWPGKGVIRKFGWMVDNRNYFWTQREKDQGAIVFCGDSLTGNWKDMAKAFPKYKVANRGIGGDVSRGLLFRFQEDALDLNPKAVVILVGTNDLTAHGSPADTVSNLAQMIAMAQKKNPDLPVILCTTPPSDNPKAPTKPGARQDLNARIAKLAGEQKNVTLCDLYPVMAEADGKPVAEYFASDRLHLAAPGYAKWSQTITPLLDKVLTAK
jgi:lysophospholipase L1-like esterase